MSTHRNMTQGRSRPSSSAWAVKMAQDRRLHYLHLADSQTSTTDQVSRENYLQHAEHFLRLATELATQPEADGLDLVLPPQEADLASLRRDHELAW